MARKNRHQRAFEQAVAAHLAGRLDDAERQYRRLLRDRPRDHEFIHQLGLIRLQQGELDEALPLLEDAAAMDPTVARYQSTLGAAYQASDMLPAARGALERAVALDPASASAWANLGVLYRLTGRRPEAAEALRRACDMQPAQPAHWQNLSAVLEQLDDLPGALAALQKAADLDPQDAETWCAQGKLHSAQGDARTAESMYRRALLCDRQHALSWANLAELLRRSGRTEEALAASERALAADAALGAAYVTFGLALRDQGHLEPAIATWQRAAAVAPTPEALLNLGDALAALGHAAHARAALQELTGRFPAYAPGWSALGGLHTGEEAARCYRRALDLDPTLEEARHLLSALEGKPADAAPPAYVRRLFDDYATRFDQHLRGELDYRAPELLLALLGGGAAPLGEVVVDLGCGTGLMGTLLRPRCGKLIGIDLSPQMLARAQARGIYDALLEGTIEAVLPTLGEVDLAVAADVLNYLGALEGFFAVAATGPVRRLAFSTEHLSPTADGPDWVLRPSGRYAHSPDYVRRLAAAHGYTVRAHQTAGLRKERGAWVEGDLLWLERG